MTADCKRIRADALACEATAIFHKYRIDELPVVDARRPARRVDRRAGHPVTIKVVMKSGTMEYWNIDVFSQYSMSIIPLFQCFDSESC
jgi:hypothetical protein